MHLAATQGHLQVVRLLLEALAWFCELGYFFKAVAFLFGGFWGLVFYVWRLLGAFGGMFFYFLF